MAKEKKAVEATPQKNSAKAVSEPVTHKKTTVAEKKQAATPQTAKAAPKKVEAPATKSVVKETTPKKATKAKVELVKEVKVKVPKTSVKTSVPYQPDYKAMEDRVDIIKEDNALVRYSDADLNEFKEIINKKLLDAKQELSYLQGLITRKDHLGGEAESRYMTMEDGTVSMEREQLSQMASRQISYIDHLEKALIRISNKTYGICRVTGKLIEKARLKAVPHATLSLEAKMTLAKHPHSK